MQMSKRLSFSIRYFMTTVWRSKPEKKNRIHKFLSTFCMHLLQLPANFRDMHDA